MGYAEIPSQETYKTHQVESGETVYSIAKKYGVSEEAIYQLNPDARNGISTTTVLIIPNVQENEPNVIGFETHKVRRKETLFSISQKYGVSIDDIKKYNKFLYSEPLKKGKKLQIPKYAKVIIADTSTETINESSDNNNASSETQIHEVQPKETFYGIARKYGISVAELKAMNPEIKDGLPIGTKLTVPNTSVIESATIEESQFDFYEVQPKEGFYRLKVKLGLSQEDIIALNPYAKDGLKDGMILKIPKEVSETIATNANKIDLENAIVNVQQKNLVVFLPFQLSQVSNDSTDTQKEILKNNRTLRIALDFYSGVLMAADFAKDKGISVDLKVYDSEGSKNTLDGILSRNDFSDVDAVIGPLLSKSVEFVAQELKRDNVPVFSPLSNRAIKLTSNLFQTLPNENFLEQQMIQYLKESYQNQKVTLIADKNSSTKQQILEAIPSATTLTPRDKGFLYVTDIQGKIDNTTENWVILESNNPVLISNVIGVLNGLNDNGNIRLFTTNRNDNFEYDDISNMHLANLGFTFPSVSKSYNYDEKDAFLVSYKNKYGVLPNRFAVRGFDLTYDVLLRLASANSVYDAIDSDSETEYVENKFRYNKKLFSGYTNQAFYILKYGEDLQFEVVK